MKPFKQNVDLGFPVNDLASGHRAAHQASDISSGEDELGIDVEPRWFGLPSFYQQLGRVKFTRAVCVFDPQVFDAHEAF